MARVHDIAWGPEIVYTYGPLAFLQTTAYYSFDQSVLATIYQPIVLAALFLGIAAALRQRRAPMTSLIGAFLTTGIVAILHIGHGGAPGLEYPELTVLAAFAWAAVPLLEHDPKRSTVFTTSIALGAVAGFELLVKFNTGLVIVAIALAVSVLLDWRAVGRHCAVVTTFAASTLIWWVLAGQRPGNLPDWLRYSLSLVSGYSGAMNLLLPLNLYAIIAIGSTLVTIVTLCVIFVRGGQAIPRRFVVLVGLVTAITAKAVLANCEIWHTYTLLGLIVVTVVITPFSRVPRLVFTVILAIVVVGLLYQERLMFLASGERAYDRVGAAVRAPMQVVDRLVTLTLPGHFDQRVEQAKENQRALYAIPNSFIKTIGSGTVHVDPDETSAVWAYDLAWRPAPLLGTYQAFTPTLDSLHSEPLAEGRTQFVLSRLSPASPAVSALGLGRLGVQESPKYSRALLCNYTVSGIEDRWALFTHTGPHCGPLTALSQVDVRGNDVINIPATSGPDMAVLVGIDLEPTPTDRLFQGMVVPLTNFTVVLDGVSYSLIAKNAAVPFLVDTPASVDGTNLQIHAQTIGVGRTLSLGQGGPVARLRFYEMRVNP